VCLSVCVFISVCVCVYVCVCGCVNLITIFWLYLSLFSGYVID
jgi:hypothetical protein